MGLYDIRLILAYAGQRGKVSVRGRDFVSPVQLHLLWLTSFRIKNEDNEIDSRQLEDSHWPATNNNRSPKERCQQQVIFYV